MLSSVLLTSLLFSYPFLASPGHAQVTRNAPVPVNGAAYVRARTKLYVQGGVVSQGGNTVAQQNQMFALDLATPWPANSPAWIPLKQGPTQALHTAAMSIDEQTFVTFRTTTAGPSSVLSFRYHMGSNTWDQSSVKAQNPNKEGISAVQDPLSGLVYLAGGYQNDDSQMYVYNIDTDTMTMFPMPSNYMADRSYYAGAYLRSRKSIIYFGGTSAGNSNSSGNGTNSNGHGSSNGNGNGNGTSQSNLNLITEYIPSTGSWSTLNVFNPNPLHRSDFCMAANDDGTKVVVFGGRLENGGYARDLWVLDVPNLTWTQGPSWNEPRASAACTVAGSTFVSWGGSNGQRTADGTVILYDLNQGQYITSFTPPPEYNKGFNGNSNVDGQYGADNGSSRGGSGSETLSDDRNKSSSMLIVGGIIGSVLVVACLALVSVFVRKHRLKIQSQCIGYSASMAPRPSTSNSFSNGGLGVKAHLKKQPQKEALSPRDAYSIDEEKQTISMAPYVPPSIPRSPPATVTSPTMIRQSTEDSLAGTSRSQWHP